MLHSVGQQMRCDFRLCTDLDTTSACGDPTRTSVEGGPFSRLSPSGARARAFLH